MKQKDEKNRTMLEEQIFVSLKKQTTSEQEPTLSLSFQQNTLSESSKYK